MGAWEDLQRREARKTRHFVRRLRKGDRVIACYDGKWGRGCEATVLRQRKGVVTAEFQRWPSAGGRTVVRFVDGGGWDRWDEGLMAMAFGLEGDWYRLVPADEWDAYRRGE